MLQFNKITEKKYWTLIGRDTFGRHMVRKEQRTTSDGSSYYVYVVHNATSDLIRINSNQVWKHEGSALPTAPRFVMPRRFGVITNDKEREVFLTLLFHGQCPYDFSEQSVKEALSYFDTAHFCEDEKVALLKLLFKANGLEENLVYKEVADVRDGQEVLVPIHQQFKVCYQITPLE